MSSTRALPPICSPAASRPRRLLALAVASLVLLPACAKWPPPGWLSKTRVPASTPASPTLGDILGHIDPDLEGHGFDGATPMIVFLSSAGGAAPAVEATSAVAEIRRDGDALSPALLVVPVNQSVEFRVADEIHHRIFSYSDPGAFDLGPLGRGESRVITFWEPGVIRLYCGLHPSESAVIFVAPSPHFAEVSATGEVALRGLLPGRYRLRTWSEALPSASLDVVVYAGRSTAVDISIPGLEESD
jgi:plastocyanin